MTKTNKQWQLVENKQGYYFWKYEDTDGRTVYNATQEEYPPKTDAGYYSYAYLLTIKGIMKTGIIYDMFVKGKP